MKQTPFTPIAAQRGAVLRVHAPAAHETLNADMDPGNGHVPIEDAVAHGGILPGGADDMLRLAGFAGGPLNSGNGDGSLTPDGPGGAEDLGEDGASGGLFDAGAAKGLEDLLFDMRGGKADTLDLDTLLSGFEGTGNGDKLVVHIMSDTGEDQIDIQGLLDSGWKCSPNGGGASVWTNPNEDLIFIIQNSLAS